jgi:hypothetical protein
LSNYNETFYKSEPAETGKEPVQTLIWCIQIGLLVARLFVAIASLYCTKLNVYLCSEAFKGVLHNKYSVAFATNILATQIVDMNAHITVFERFCDILSNYNEHFNSLSLPKQAKSLYKP